MLRITLRTKLIRPTLVYAGAQKMTEQIAGHENAGHEIARHDKH